MSKVLKAALLLVSALGVCAAAQADPSGTASGSDNAAAGVATGSLATAVAGGVGAAAALAAIVAGTSSTPSTASTPSTSTK